MITDISALDLKKTYTYADYLKWQFTERVELIKGKIFKMSPAPGRLHQKTTVKLISRIDRFLEGKKCEVYSAPFDVRFPKDSDDNKTYTVVQPDLCIICDQSKLDDKGCLGAPDMIIEILSPKTAKNDIKDKFQLYEENGVSEYWIVSPENRVVDVFILKEDQKYHLIGKFADDDKVKVNIFDGLEINLTEIFLDN
jgi:Uma2 family endonuclease